MDDPDVDLELIALLRESLGFSNKAQEGVSDNTGRCMYLFVAIVIILCSVRGSVAPVFR